MKRWMVLVVVALLVIGCAPTMVQGVQNQIAQQAQTSDAASLPAHTVDLPAFVPIEQDTPDTPAPTAPDGDLAALAAGNNAFALDVLAVLRRQQPDANVLYSPFSIYSAFAMVYAGAENETAAQLAEVLHYDLSAGALHPAIGAWVTQLTDSTQEGFTLNIANALWGQQGASYESAFLETLAQYYGAALQQVDFAGNSKGAADAVNQWVSDATNGKIPAVVDTFSPDTALVLANAIYFNAQWSNQFDTTLTHDAPFTALDGTEQTASMMGVTDWFAYEEGEGYQIVGLPYAGGEARMIVLLPTSGTFEAFEQNLTAEEFTAMLATMDAEERKVMLQLPAFEMESTTSLESVLGELGLTLPFSSDADLSGINGQNNLAIDQAIHKATITVDEAGTEAAAATVIVVTTLAMPVEQDAPVAMTVDRPFLYFIQDTDTGALLFVGRMVTLP